MQKRIVMLIVLAGFLTLLGGCQTKDGKDPIGPAPDDQIEISDINVETWLRGSQILGRLSFETNFPSKASVAYDPSPTNLRRTAVDTAAYVRLHQIDFASLANSIAYYFRITAWTSDSLRKVTEMLTFHTPDTADLPRAPVITNISVGSQTTNSVVVSWKTDVPADSRILWGMRTDTLDDSLVTATLVTDHSANVADLEQGMIYYYKVVAVNESGYRADSDILTFRTLGAPEDSTIRTVQVDYATNSTAGISWITNDRTDSRIVWGSDSTRLDSSKVIIESKYTHVIGLKRLLPNTVYFFRVASQDNFGYMRFSDTLNFTTSNVINLRAPDTTMALSSRLTYPLQVSDAVDLAGLGITLTYRADVVRIDSIRGGPFFTENDPDFFRPRWAQGEIRIDMNWHIIYSGNVQMGTRADGSGIFVNIYCTSIHPGTCPIIFVPAATKAYDVRVQEIDVTLTNGSVSVP